MESNLTHQLLMYDDDNVNILDKNIDILRRSKGALLQAGREAGLEVNTEKTKYRVMSGHQNTEQNHRIMITNKNLLRTRVTSQNCIHKEIKSRLISGNVCYHCAQNLFIFQSPLLELKS